MKKKQIKKLFWVSVDAITLYTLSLLMALTGFGYLCLMVMYGYPVIPTVFKSLILTAFSTTLVCVTFWSREE